MNTKLIALLTVSVAAIGAAQAVTFDFQSTGTYTTAGANYSASDTTLVNYLAPTGTGLVSAVGVNFVSISYTIASTWITPSLGLGTGSGTLTVNNGSNRILAISPFTLSLAKNAAGKISFSSTTFGLAGLGGTGSGKISGTLESNGISKTTFIGVVNPVPEPASMAALAVGAVGLIRRRRKA